MWGKEKQDYHISRNTNRGIVNYNIRFMNKLVGSADSEKEAEFVIDKLVGECKAWKFNPELGEPFIGAADWWIDAITRSGYSSQIGKFIDTGGKFLSSIQYYLGNRLRYKPSPMFSHITLDKNGVIVGRILDGCFRRWVVKILTCKRSRNNGGIRR